LVEETEVPGENHQPAASHWQTLSYDVVHLKSSIRRQYNYIRRQYNYIQKGSNWNVAISGVDATPVLFTRTEMTEIIHLLNIILILIEKMNAWFDVLSNYFI
jgi:hypothetical protein